jgi:hypothetical protein
VWGTGHHHGPGSDQTGCLHEILERGCAIILSNEKDWKERTQEIGDRCDSVITGRECRIVIAWVVLDIV